MARRVVVVLMMVVCLAASPSAARDPYGSGGFRNAGVARLVIVLSLLNASALSTGSIADLDRKNGFRDVRFGAAASDFPEMVEVATHGELSFYRRPADSHRIGKARLDSVAYGFRNGRLGRIVIYATRGPEHSAELLRAVQSVYGRSSRVDSTAGERVWDGDRVQMSLLRDRSDRTRLVIQAQPDDVREASRDTL